MERRREVLRGCGTTLLAGLAGCAGGSELDGSDGESGDNGGDGSSGNGDEAGPGESDGSDGDESEAETDTDRSLATPDSGWTSRGGGPGATNVVDAAGPEARPGVDWTYPIPGGSGAGDTYVPAVGDDVVYSACVHEGTLHVAAVDATDGAERWQRTIETDAYVDLNATTAPALTESSLVVGYDRGTVALSRADGAIQWERAIDLTGPVVDDGVLFGLETFAVTDAVHALDPATGEERWSRDVGGGDGRFGVLVDDERVYAFEAVDRRVHRIVALDRSGNVEWNAADYRLQRLPAVRDGTLVAHVRTAGAEEHLVAFDTADGTERWRRPDVSLPGLAFGSDGLYVASWAGNGTETSRVTTRDPADGTTAWERTVELRAPDVVVGDDVCYLYSFPDSAIVALEAGSGDRLWRAEGVTLADVSVGENGMYETETGELRCYR